MATYMHRDGSGKWHPYTKDINTLIDRAFNTNAERVRLPLTENGEFELRFGLNATSKKMRSAPETDAQQNAASAGSANEPVSLRELRSVSLRELSPSRGTDAIGVKPSRKNFPCLGGG